MSTPEPSSRFSGTADSTTPTASTGPEKREDVLDQVKLSEAHVVALVNEATRSLAMETWRASVASHQASQRTSEIAAELKKLTKAVTRLADAMTQSTPQSTQRKDELGRPSPAHYQVGTRGLLRPDIR